MKEYKLIRVYGNKSKFLNNENYYYVFDETDGSVELWGGKKLGMGSQNFSVLHFYRGLFVVRDNELIIADTGYFKHVWYKGYDTVWTGDGMIQITSLRPVRLSGNAVRTNKVRIQFRDALRIISMEMMNGGG